RDVDLAQLRDGERVRGEREADVRVRELCAETGARGADELPLVRRAGNGRVGKLPLGRDEAEVGGGERSVAQDARLELLDVGECLHVDEPGERTLERLAASALDASQEWLEPTLTNTQHH